MKDTLSQSNMSDLFKSFFLWSLLTLLLTSCELFYTFCEDKAISLSLDAFVNSFEFTLDNITRQEVENIYWEAKVYDIREREILSCKDSISFLSGRHELDIFKPVCSCDNPYRVNVKVRWDNPDGESCSASSTRQFFY